MRLKSFMAGSMREAMQQVKEELGEDAIIVTTRELSGGRVRLTAAIEQDARHGIDLPEFDLDDDEAEGNNEDSDTDIPWPPEDDVKPIADTEKVESATFHYAWRPPPIEDSPLGIDDDQSDEDDPLSQWLFNTEGLGKEGQEKPAQKTVYRTTQDDIVEHVTDAMIRHRFPSALNDKIIAASTMNPQDTLKATLAAALGEVFEFDHLPQKPTPKPIILVGPPGAGKTLNTAKLATRAVQAGMTPTVISTDIVRAGGLEMLGAFLDILDLPLHAAHSAAELKDLITEHKGADQILIDTGGLSPFDPHEMKELARLLRITDMNSVLVLPGGGDAEESGEMALTFELLGVKKILPTRLDFARRLGGVMSAADRGGLAFAGASHTHRIPDGILDITPEIFADLLMPGSPFSE